MVELEGRANHARVLAATDVARLTLGALQDLNLPISDRDRMLAKDMITTAAFTQPGQGQLGAEEDKDICLQQFCAERGKAGGTSASERGPRSCTWTITRATSFQKRMCTPTCKSSRQMGGWRA